MTNYYFLHKKTRISALAAYAVIIVLVVATAFILSRLTSKDKAQIITRASKNTAAQFTTVSNVTYSSAVVSFVSAEETTAFIEYGTEQNLQQKQIQFDDRDSPAQEARTAHYFTLQGLEANTQYFYRVNTENNAPSSIYHFKTLSAQLTNASNTPIFGQVLHKDLKPAKKILITVSISTVTTMKFSTLSSENGEWIIPFPILVNKDLQPVSLSKNEMLTITFYHAANKTEVKVLYQHAAPLKSVILGNEYNFTSPLTSDEHGKKDIAVNQTGKGLVITYPLPEAIIPGRYPVFRGSSFPNSFIEIRIEPRGGNTVLATDYYGEWKYEPKQALEPGRYIFTVREKKGGVILSRVFHISKSGEAVLGEATPSGDTATPTPSPTVPTPTPILAIEPTSTSSATATPTVASPTVQTEIPTAGNSPGVWIASAAAVSILGLLLIIF